MFRKKKKIYARSCQSLVYCKVLGMMVKLFSRDYRLERSWSQTDAYDEMGRCSPAGE